MVQHLSQAPWLAKDVVWLVTDARCGLIPSMEVRCDEAESYGMVTDSIDHRVPVFADRGAARVDIQQCLHLCLEQSQYVCRERWLCSD